ncbi:MAG TPA: Zn-ribbon domain-containing OB-fold protein [Candidatus Aenigmarchaeota archaeon]|nr:Zn-ribbon domain-containing OB-fold protein [Candidatus Aenigmarchaeota archaeon]
MSREFAVPFHWRRFRERYQLIGSKCEHCNGVFYPPRIVCPRCRRRGKVKSIKLSGRGRVYTYTIIRTPPEGFKIYTPYIIAIVELEEGAKILTQIVDCMPDEVYIGMPVKACFRKIKEENESGIILYGFKFKPDTQAKQG